MVLYIGNCSLLVDNVDQQLSSGLGELGSRLWVEDRGFRDCLGSGFELRDSGCRFKGRGTWGAGLKAWA